MDYGCVDGRYNSQTRRKLSDLDPGEIGLSTIGERPGGG
jgi:hypothetical protein